MDLTLQQDNEAAIKGLFTIDLEGDAREQEPIQKKTIDSSINVSGSGADDVEEGELTEKKEQTATNGEDHQKDDKDKQASTKSEETKKDEEEEKEVPEREQDLMKEYERKALKAARYFCESNPFIICFHCRQPGHYASNCPNAKKVKNCYLCGSLDHIGNICPAVCFKCNKSGHRVGDCPAKHSSQCDRCLNFGHLSAVCLQKTEIVERNLLRLIQCFKCRKFTSKSNCCQVEPIPTRNTSCYSCGSDDHFGEDCSITWEDHCQSASTERARRRFLLKEHRFKMHRQGDEAKKSDANRTVRGVNETDPRSFGNNDPHDRSSKYPRKKNLRIEMSNRGGPTRESENIDTTAIATNAQWMMMNPNQLNQLAQTSNQMTPVNPMNTLNQMNRMDHIGHMPNDGNTVQYGGDMYVGQGFPQGGFVVNQGGTGTGNGAGQDEYNCGNQDDQIWDDSSNGSGGGFGQGNMFVQGAVGGFNLGQMSQSVDMTQSVMTLLQQIQQVQAANAQLLEIDAALSTSNPTGFNQMAGQGTNITGMGGGTGVPNDQQGGYVDNQFQQGRQHFQDQQHQGYFNNNRM